MAGSSSDASSDVHMFHESMVYEVWLVHDEWHMETARAPYGRRPEHPLLCMMSTSSDNRRPSFRDSAREAMKRSQRAVGCIRGLRAKIESDVAGQDPRIVWCRGIKHTVWDPRSSLETYRVGP